MKRAWIEFTAASQSCPLTRWVHGDLSAAGVRVPEPWPLPQRGYPQFLVELDGFCFRFASLAEMDACIKTLGTPLLPSTRLLTQRLGLPRGAHWLDAMPDWTKPWRYREKAVRYLRRARVDLAKQLDEALRRAVTADLLP